MSSAFDLAQTVSEWQTKPPTDAEKVKFYKETIKALDDPKQASELSKNLEGLAIAAVKTDNSFAKVSRYFQHFVEQNGKDFQGLAAFWDQWNALQRRWRTLINQSRDLATETASNYEDYDAALLKSLQQLKTKEDMLAIAKDLEEFSKNKPQKVPADMSQKFSKLKNDVAIFRSNFYRYLDEQKTKLDTRAKQLQLMIEKLKQEIDGLTAGIALALGVVGLGAWWNLVISALAVVAIIGMAIRRHKAYGELATAQNELGEVNRKQDALAHIRSDFDGLAPDFILICDSLQLFADIWNEFHKESLEFAEELRRLPDAKYPEIFKLRIELARKTAAPLRDGLRTYANKIHL